MVLPILAIPFVYAFWNLRSRIRKESFKDKFFATVVILYYIMFPSIVNRVAVTFACISVGDGSDHRRLMQEAMDTECYSVHHILVILLIALPAFVLYITLIPLFAIRRLSHLRKSGQLFAFSENYNSRSNW